MDWTRAFGEIESFSVISTIDISSTDAQHSSVQQWEGWATLGTHSLHQLVSCGGASDPCEQTGSASSPQIIHIVQATLLLPHS